MKTYPSGTDEFCDSKENTYTYCLVFKHLQFLNFMTYTNFVPYKKATEKVEIILQSHYDFLACCSKFITFLEFRKSERYKLTASFSSPNVTSISERKSLNVLHFKTNT